MSVVSPLPARRRAHPSRPVDSARVHAAVAEAVEAERARTRAWLHDTLLQQLEYLAAGGYADVADARELMRVAAGAASDLRAYVEDTPSGTTTIVEALRRAIAEEQLRSAHEIRLVFGDVDGTVDGSEGADIVAATREALTNVRKHARASQAVVSCVVSAGVATVVVADDGAGFDLATARHRGSGLRESIVGRMARSGGTAVIASAPGEGTRVTLKAHVPLAGLEPLKEVA
jgi:signal transduction histidine kinase